MIESGENRTLYLQVHQVWYALIWFYQEPADATISEFIIEYKTKKILKNKLNDINLNKTC